jgi:hypothetical protein
VFPEETPFQALCFIYGHSLSFSSLLLATPYLSNVLEKIFIHRFVRVY